ncbi:MAG: class B sortase [Gallintestinimicrobium sp.]
MAAFTVLFGVSSYFIIDHYREAEHQEQLYDSLVQLVEDSETEPAEPIIYSEDKTILPELTELYRQNNDLVGWICVEDTNINYPVMQTVDNPNYYLKRGFDKEYSSYGCPYVQEDCDVLKPSDNVVIYGHRMNRRLYVRPGLTKFKNKSFWKKHKNSILDTLNLTDRSYASNFAAFETVEYTDSPDSFKYIVSSTNADTAEDFTALC